MTLLIKVQVVFIYIYLVKIICYNEDNEVRKQSEDKIEQNDNEDYNEEIPISK